MDVMNVDLSSIVLAACRGEPCPEGADEEDIAAYGRLVQWFGDLPEGSEVDWESALFD